MLFRSLSADDARLTARVYGVGGVLYAAHSTQLGSRVAIQWYRVRAADNVLLESGVVTDPNLDMFYPSIAANAYGVVVIAFNALGLFADPHFALPVAPAFVLLGCGALLGRR